MYPHAFPPVADAVKVILKNSLKLNKEGRLHGNEKVTKRLLSNMFDFVDHISDYTCDTVEQWGKETSTKPGFRGKLRDFPFTLEKLEPLTEDSMVARMLYTCRFLYEQAYVQLEAGDSVAFVHLYAAAYRLDGRPIIHDQGAPEIWNEVRTTGSIDAQADALFLLAHPAFSAQEFEFALELIGQALRLKPDDSQFHFMRGIILNSMTNFQAADLALQSASAIDDEPEYLWMRGCILENMGGNGPTSLDPADQRKMRDGARCLLDEFVHRSPPESDKVCQAYYHMAEMEIANGNLGSARRLLDKGLAAEQHQLPCFHGPPSQFRQRVEVRLRKIHACGWESCQEVGVESCSGCLRVHYCSRVCQKLDWKGHKPNCQKKNDTKSSRSRR